MYKSVADRERRQAQAKARLAFKRVLGKMLAVNGYQTSLRNGQIVLDHPFEGAAIAITVSEPKSL